MGDSYAQGFQSDGDLSHGFADLVVSRLADRPRGAHLTLANFACGGATIQAMLDHPGCAFPPRPETAVPYPDVSQVTAVEQFIVAHPGQVKLISISIGGNDVQVCANAQNPITCGFTQMQQLGPNLTTLLTRIRNVAPDVPIIGTTYPNTLLAQWVHAPTNLEVARVSTRLMSEVFNPELKSAYDAAHAIFVDVTALTGGYGPLTTFTTVDPYGQIPTAVATVCELTSACKNLDVHPNDEGYSVIADEMLDAIPASLGGGGGVGASTTATSVGG
jgi:lysophospholipase L1-like esterase